MGPDPVFLDVQAFLEKASKDLVTAERMAEEPGVSAVLPSVETLTRDCTLLTDFGVAPRYPGWEPVSGVIELEEVLVAARRMLEWAQAVAVTPQPSGE